MTIFGQRYNVLNNKTDYFQVVDVLQLGNLCRQIAMLVCILNESIMANAWKLVLKDSKQRRRLVFQVSRFPVLRTSSLLYGHFILRPRRAIDDLQINPEQLCFHFS